MHGLGGGPKDTWTYRASQTDHRFWPDWLLKDIPGLAAYTVSYPADKMGWNKGWPIACYKTQTRTEIEHQGFTVIANIGDQLSDLAGGHAEKTFKVSNPFYFIDGGTESDLGCATY